MQAGVYFDRYYLKSWMQALEAVWNPDHSAVLPGLLPGLS
jgi:hypothetical protein